jgi:guanine nucleotide-binding protein G(i) subunit alpha
VSNMGGCFSSPRPEDATARQRTQEIDKKLEEDYRRLRKEVKILLLGILCYSGCSNM